MGQLTDARTLCPPQAVLRQIVISNRILGDVDAGLESRFQPDELFFGEIRAFENGFLNPISELLQNLHRPVADAIVHNVEAYDVKHGWGCIEEQEDEQGWQCCRKSGGQSAVGDG